MAAVSPRQRERSCGTDGGVGWFTPRWSTKTPGPNEVSCGADKKYKRGQGVAPGEIGTGPNSGQEAG